MFNENKKGFNYSDFIDDIRINLLAKTSRLVGQYDRVLGGLKGWFHNRNITNTWCICPVCTVLPRSGLEAMAFLKKVKHACKGKLPRIFIDGGSWYPRALERAGFERHTVVSFRPRSAIEQLFADIEKQLDSFGMVPSERTQEKARSGGWKHSLDSSNTLHKIMNINVSQ